jgi:F-type H+-transporting ATPase subunit delta
VTARGSATRYARALFDVALRERADLDTLQQELTGFAALVTSHEVLERALMNPAVPAVKKRAVVDALFDRGGHLHPILGKLVALLADRDRLTLLPDLAAAFERRLMDHRHVVRAELSTAVELPADRVAALKEGLAQATGRDVRIETRVDPTLVGGAVARIGSTVYDGSVTTQLQKLKRSLIESAQ